MSHTLKAIVIGSLALLVAGCGQRDHHDRRDRQDRMQNQPATQSSNQPAAQGERPRLGRACAADLQQYCANEPKRFRCLRENEDKLSAGCKTAFDQMREWHRQHRMERNGNQQGGGRHHGDDGDDQ